jgi:hypothetical protein
MDSGMIDCSKLGLNVKRFKRGDRFIMHNENRNKGMAKPVVLAVAAAVTGALSVFAVMKWKHAAIDQSPPVASGIQATPTPSASKPTDLETLVAPIALYPDPLLAQLLPASTYPLEVVQAARWLAANPNVRLATGQDWAPSIVALLEFPQVISMMNDRLEWTTQLGDRFLAEPEAMLGSIQSLRAKALAAGLLKDSPEQKVTKASITKVSAGDQEVAGTWVEAPSVPSSVRKTQTEVVRIEPANPQVIYVPQYNPQVLYSPPPAQAYHTTTATTTTSQASPWLTFGTGVATGALLGWAISEWSDDDWDDHHHGYYHYPAISHYPNYHHGYYGKRVGNEIDIDRNVNINADEINVNRNNPINNRPRPIAWVHDPKHRRGYRYTPQAQQRLAAVQPKPQPALAGQRKRIDQGANLEYAGFDRDQMDRARQAQIEKALGQTNTSLRKRQDKASPERIVQSLNDPNEKSGISRRPAAPAGRKNDFSSARKNKPVAAERERRFARSDVQPGERGPARTSGPSLRAKSLPQQQNLAGKDLASRSASGGMSEGGMAKPYRQRGQSSRAPASGTSDRRSAGGIRRR